MGNGTHFYGKWDSFLITYFSFLHMPDSMLSISAADSPTPSSPSSPQPSTSAVHQKKKKKKKKKKKSKASRACVDLDTQEIRMNGKENVISLSFLIKSIKFLNGAITMPS